jgi:hypothetical protein
MSTQEALQPTANSERMSAINTIGMYISIVIVALLLIYDLRKKYVCAFLYITLAIQKLGWHSGVFGRIHFIDSLFTLKKLK